MENGPGADVARGGGGNDFSQVSSPGSARWFGGAGRDHLTDFNGVDLVNGGPGDDSCLATFDGSGGDTLIGGLGFDIWYADAADEVQGVEQRILCYAG